MRSHFSGARWAVPAMLLIPLGAHADDAAAVRRIEAAIDAARKRYFVPGASLAVVKDGQIVLLKGFGYRDAAKKLKATPDTTFCIGSSTKAFTALLVAQAAQEGKLSLDDSPHKYLPEFRLKDPEADQKITITDMLCHRSGLPRVDLVWYTGKFDRADMFDLIAGVEPTAKLRQKWQYQNFMFMAAGVLAGRVYGESYEALVKDRIFDPLGMSHTTVSYDGAMASQELAQGYAPSGPLTPQRPLPYRKIDVAAPAGAINSTARDMAQWVRLQLADGTFDGKPLFAQKAIAETRKQRIEMVPGSGMGYGFGWMLRKWHETPLVEHGGNIDGYNAEVAFLPEKHVGFAMLTNVSASPLTQEAIELIFKELVPEEPKKVEPPKTAAAYKEIPDSDLGDYEIATLKVKLGFKREKGRVVLIQGPAHVPLKLIADERYQTDMQGAPDVKLTWQASKKDPKQREILLEQSGMKFTLVKEPPYAAPMTGRDLLAKVVAAQGGPDARLKQRHMVCRFVGSMPSDGVTLRGYSFAEGGRKSAQFAVFFALNRPFGTIHSFTDGQVAREDVSFAPSDWKSGTALADAINAANVLADLDPLKAYKSLKIVKEDKIGDRDVFVLERQPIAGSASTLYVSKKDFRVLREQVGASTTDYDDYRTIDGVCVPFKQTVQGAEGGKQIMQIEAVDFTAPIPHWAFRYTPTKH